MDDMFGLYFITARSYPRSSSPVPRPIPLEVADDVHCGTCFSKGWTAQRPGRESIYCASPASPKGANACPLRAVAVHVHSEIPFKKSRSDQRDWPARSALLFLQRCNMALANHAKLVSCGFLRGPKRARWSFQYSKGL